MEYQRITAGGKTIDLQVISVTDEFLTGYEVSRDGSRKGWLHLIDQTMITARVDLEMNLHYGELQRKPRWQERDLSKDLTGKVGS